MAESVVKLPNNPNADYDFIAFSFNGKHSYEDFGLVRVSDSNRYSNSLAPSMSDKTAEVPGGNGMYYFGTTHKQKEFPISFAFDHLTEKKYKEMKQWLNGKTVGNLWFAEEPYKVWTAKVTGQPSIKYICFDEYEDGKKIRIYKGEGSVTFTSYYPYAHTPTYVELLDGTKLPGNCFQSYQNFSNFEQIKKYLPNFPVDLTNSNYGDLPFTFVAYLDDVTSTRNSTMSVSADGIIYTAATWDGIDYQEEENV